MLGFIYHMMETLRMSLYTQSCYYECHYKTLQNL